MKLRRGVNFAHNIEKYEKREKFFAYFRYFSIILTIVISAITTFLIYQNVNSNIQLRKTTEEKEALLQSILEKTTRNEKLSIIAKKTSLIKKLLKEDDANFIRYYELIKRFIKEDKNLELLSNINNLDASNSAALENIIFQEMSLKTTKETFLRFSASNKQLYKKLLDLIEDNNFLKLFTRLEVSKIIIEQSTTSADLQLELSGKFNESAINEENK